MPGGGGDEDQVDSRITSQLFRTGFEDSDSTQASDEKLPNFGRTESTEAKQSIVTLPSQLILLDFFKFLSEWRMN